MAEEFPDAHRDDRYRVERLIDAQVSDVRTALWVLLAAVAMVLLIACANVANLMLVRAGGRTEEVALRATLGASRVRIVRQLLTESLLVGGLAGIAGVALAGWGIRVFVALAPEALPRIEEARLDGTALLLAGALVLLVTAAFGAIPAAQLSSQRLVDGSAGGTRSTASRGVRLSRSLLLASEVALSLSLLLGAGLLFRTLGEIRSVEVGYATEGVERFRVNTPNGQYDTDATVLFQRTLEERLAAVPGVESVGMGFGVPLASGSLGANATFLDRPPVDAADRPTLAIRPSSPGFLEASGTPLLRGRWFTRADTRDAEAVAVINKTAADLHYPQVDPIGRQLEVSVSWGYEDNPSRTIVGIVADVRAAGATEEPEPALYIPNAQFGANSAYVTMRLESGVTTVMPGARAVLRELDPDLAITSVERIEDAVAEDQASTRFYLTLLSVFSVLALLLAAVGLYGVVDYSVSQRTREIGIRMALGARSDSVIGLVLRDGVRPAVAGAILGLGISWLGAELLERLLYEVRPHDPATAAGATGVLLSVVLAATLLPAMRAARVPPATALRAE